MQLQGEFRKMAISTFFTKKEDDAEAWILNMIKYLQVYEYESNLKAQLVI